MDYQTVNVAALGICFLVFFSGYNSLADIQKTLLSSAHDDNPKFNVDGYTYLGALYSSFAVFIWFSPSAISLIGPRLTMFFGAVLYIIPPITIFLEEAWVLYLAGFVNGIGSALIWTGSANYLVLNSSEKTLARNTGLFWLFYQSGQLPGNLFIFFAFRSVTVKIDEATRHLVLYGMIGILTTGAIMFLFLRREFQDGKLITIDSPLQAFKKAWTIAKSKNTAILFAAFAYCGLHLSFITGVYGASIGFTLQLGEGVKKLIPLSSILIGCGEVSGGILVRIFGNINIFRINLLFVLAVIGNIICYVIAFISLPANANFGNTYDESIIEPRLWLLLIASYLFGMGDSFIHTQLYTLVGSLYPEDSAPAFSIFKFLRSAFTAACFYYSRYLHLTTQLIILTVAGISGMISFNVMNYIYERKKSIVKN